MADYSVGDTSQDPVPSSKFAMSSNGDEIMVRSLRDVNNFCCHITLQQKLGSLLQFLLQIPSCSAAVN